ncbi:Alpha/Beta hydrolase protein [Apiosordaria backusii]|uniref:Carboxypeptidase n=1 Tax=Apiosordaria backusii TaxID=314023 RepID=A0AA40BT91_9PEZI|nr:Alpha/Beta hydrolase protein [Apiosordaria backusii]
MRLLSILGLLLTAVEGLRPGRGHHPTRLLNSKGVKNVSKLKAAVFPGPQDKGFPKHRFLNANTTKFAVNGTNIPDVDFDVGESYAGSLPISKDHNEQNNLFFWFFPSTNVAADKEIVIWLNGGPGCSSFEGLLHEHGPFLWQPGTYKPMRNNWSWHNLTNIVYVEQPVGTGFSAGVPTIASEEALATQFQGWWKNFVDTFSMQGYKVYIAGESYAGKYCPYIASAMLDANDTTYYQMSGMLINNALIHSYDLQQDIPIVRFIEHWGSLFPFNDTFRSHIKSMDAQCGFSAFVDTYLTFPPISPLPSILPGIYENGTWSEECYHLYDEIWLATTLQNPCFSLYHITDFCPRIWDVLGFLASTPYLPSGTKAYFDRNDVKAAIHAPQNKTWSLCADEYVFAGSDSSEPSTMYALPNVINKTGNVIIAHGQLDMVILSNGTLLAIQNMTWGGKLGFQNRPTEPFYVPFVDVVGETGVNIGGAGVMGSMVSERGLTWVGVNQAGHMLPEYAPAASYRQLEFLLGRVDCMNCTKPFTVEQLYYPEEDQGDMGQGTAPQGWSDQKSERYWK